MTCCFLQKNRKLFIDKTSNLQGQVLKVVTFEHVPTTAVLIPSTSNQSSENTENQQVYAGLEIEVREER